MTHGVPNISLLPSKLLN